MQVKLMLAVAISLALMPLAIHGHDGPDRRGRARAADAEGDRSSASPSRSPLALVGAAVQARRQPPRHDDRLLVRVAHRPDQQHARPRSSGQLYSPVRRDGLPDVGGDQIMIEGLARELPTLSRSTASRASARSPARSRPTARQVCVDRPRDRRAGAGRARHRRRGVRPRVARRAADERVRRRPAGQDPGRLAGRSAPRCRSSPATSGTQLQQSVMHALEALQTAGGSTAATTAPRSRHRKRREEARKKGQIARSADVNSAVGAARGVRRARHRRPAHARPARRSCVRTASASRPTPTSPAGPGSARCSDVGDPLVRSRLVAPDRRRRALLAGLVANVVQVRPKITRQALKPQFEQHQPAHGLKRLFGVEGLFERGKAIAKTRVVGGVAVHRRLAALPQLGRSPACRPATILRAVAARDLRVALYVVRRAHRASRSSTSPGSATSTRSR